MGRMAAPSANLPFSGFNGLSDLSFSRSEFGTAEGVTFALADRAIESSLSIIVVRQALLCPLRESKTSNDVSNKNQIMVNLSSDVHVSTVNSVPGKSIKGNAIACGNGRQKKEFLS